MYTSFLKSIVTFCLVLISAGLFAQCNSQQKDSEKNNKSVMFASAEMQTTPDIVGVASSKEDFSTLVAAVKAADLVEALQGEGPFTVFAPTNSAFNALPEGTVSTLLKPENKEKLKSVLTYHVVSGELDSKAVAKAIKSGNGTATVTTLNGAELQAMLMDGNVVLKDANGNMAQVVAVDVKASNGVIHVIDTVVMP